MILDLVYSQLDLSLHFHYLLLACNTIIGTFHEQVLHLFESILKDVFELFISFIVISELIEASKFVATVFMDGFACEIIFNFGLRIVYYMQLVLDLYYFK